MTRCGSCGQTAHATPAETSACRELFWLARLEMTMIATTQGDTPRD